MILINQLKKNFGRQEVLKGIDLHFSAGEGLALIGPKGLLPSDGHGILVEVSGGITLDTVGAYARAGADIISAGALTHSAPSVDLALDFVAEGA